MGGVPELDQQPEVPTVIPSRSTMLSPSKDSTPTSLLMLMPSPSVLPMVAPATIWVVTALMPCWDLEHTSTGLSLVSGNCMQFIQYAFFFGIVSQCVVSLNDWVLFFYKPFCLKYTN